MGALRVVAVAAGVLSVGAVATAITIFNLPREESSAATEDTPPTTAEVTKGTLVDRQSFDGTLAHGDTTSITTWDSGVVTKLPAENTTIKRGRALYYLDNEPITLLYGTLPAYRTLQSGAEGADVKQFEKNLWALGYRGFAVDDTYSSSTASAVKDWQEDLELTETGTVETSQILYAAGEVRIDSLTVQAGARVAGGSEVEQITGTSTLATVELSASSVRLAKKGATVKVTLPDGKEVNGKIIDVSTVVTEGSDGAPDTTTYKVIIEFTSKVKNQGNATVSVAFTTGERKDVLTVPVKALIALAEGGYGVQAVHNGATTVVAVETGLFADGKVEISGTGVQVGMTVVVPS